MKVELKEFIFSYGVGVDLFVDGEFIETFRAGGTSNAIEACMFYLREFENKEGDVSREAQSFLYSLEKSLVKRKQETNLYLYSN